MMKEMGSLGVLGPTIKGYGKLNIFQNTFQK